LTSIPFEDNATNRKFTDAISYAFKQKVDLSKLEMPALLNYWRHFNLVSWIPEEKEEKKLTFVFSILFSMCLLLKKLFVGGCNSKSIKGATNWHCSKALHVSGTSTSL